MLIIRSLILLLIFLYSMLIAIGLFQNNQLILGMIAGTIGFIWVFGHFNQWKTLLFWLFFLVYLMAGVAAFKNVNVVQVYISCIAALMVMDLEYFFQYLNSANKVYNQYLLVRRYCIKLFCFAIMCMIFGLLAFLIDFRLNFYLTILLVCILFFSFKQLSRKKTHRKNL
jgi:hypothetical protein